MLSLDGFSKRIEQKIEYEVQIVDAKITESVKDLREFFNHQDYDISTGLEREIHDVDRRLSEKSTPKQMKDALTYLT